MNFNANVVTLQWTPASRYRQLAELFLGQLYHSGCSLILRPIPVIVEQVTTLTGPGELIDVVVTEPESPSTPSARICSMPSGEGSSDSP